MMSFVAGVVRVGVQLLAVVHNPPEEPLQTYVVCPSAPLRTKKFPPKINRILMVVQIPRRENLLSCGVYVFVISLIFWLSDYCDH